MEKLNKLSESLKNFFAMLREAAIILLVCFIIIFPKQLNLILYNAGFTKGKIGDFEWENKLADSKKSLLDAGEATAHVEEQLDKFQSVLDSTLKTVKDTTSLKRIKRVKVALDGFKLDMNDANQSLKRSVVQQDEVISNVQTFNAQPDSGWVYLGKANTLKNQWIPTATVPITKTPLNEIAVSGKSSIDVNDNVYLRHGTNAIESGYSNLPIQSVVKKGASITVTKLKFVPSRDGNFFVWACTIIDK